MIRIALSFAPILAFLVHLHALESFWLLCWGKVLWWEPDSRVENASYLGMFKTENLFVWAVRGFGAALRLRLLSAVRARPERATALQAATEPRKALVGGCRI